MSHNPINVYAVEQEYTQQKHPASPRAVFWARKNVE